MDILVVGGGGREHAIIKKLKESPLVKNLYCTPGNGGIASDAICFPLKATDIEGIVSLAKEKQIDLVVVGPDDPLVAGMVDALEAAGIKAFGPKKNAAIIEGSKAFSKDLMKKYNIPTASSSTFTDFDSALAYIKSQNTYPTVIKADGLALGKGVVISETLAEAEQALREMMLEKVFGDSGCTVVIEEFLTGVEISVLAFTDGKTLRPMVSSKDHKRALDNDQGLNTGGMGTISPHPLYDSAMADRCMKEIFMPTINAMSAEGRPFSGCLYFGLILTVDGPKVIEYNARFGDPETQVVLPLLEGDLAEIFLAVAEERLAEVEFTFATKAAACVVMASGGYPQAYQTGYEITGLANCSATVYHAGTKLEDGKLVTAGGRVLGVTAVRDNLQDAIDAAYEGVSQITFKNAHFRKDIGIIR